MLPTDLATYLGARYTLIYLVTTEERRALEALEAHAAQADKVLVTWSQSRGARGPGVRTDPATRDPLHMLETVTDLPDNALIVLCDFHPFLGNHTIVRSVREAGVELEATGKTLLFLAPALVLPPDLEKEVVVVDLPLPDGPLLRATFDEIAASLPSDVPVRLSPPELEALLRSAQGLTQREFSNVLAKAIVTHGRVDPRVIEVINLEKRQIIRKSAVLDFYPARDSFGAIGGLERLKAWLDSRGRAFTEAARAFGLPWPKGALIVGVQGCGKSLCAKAIAQQWRLPLLKLDMGRLFGGLVGSSEGNMRRAIQLANSIAPCVLWIDEIEKGLSGLGGSNITDGGTTARVIGTFLTWMQEKTEPVFVVATSNDIQALPPELLRKGRFDEIFFVDLPSTDERRAIFAIHLTKRARDPAAFDLEALAAASRGSSGAEIEEAVVSGLFAAFEGGRELVTDDLLRAIGETVPLSVVMEERIAELRQWAKMRTRSASEAEPLRTEVKASIADRIRRISRDN